MNLDVQTLIGLGALIATACGVLAGCVQAFLAYAFGFGVLKADVRAIRDQLAAAEKRQSEQRDRHDREMEAVWHEFGELRNVTGSHGQRLAGLESRLSIHPIHRPDGG